MFDKLIDRFSSRLLLISIITVISIILVFVYAKKGLDLLYEIDNLKQIWSYEEVEPLKPYNKKGDIKLFPETTDFGTNTIHVSGQNCLTTLVKCDTRDVGINDKCNFCQQTNASCIHHDEPFTIYTEVFDHDELVSSNNENIYEKQEQKIGERHRIDVPANETPYEGYCTITGSVSGSNNSSTYPLRKCNKNTGDRILMKLNENSQGYAFACNCKNNNIITQEIPLFSDCDVPVSCEATGGKTDPSWKNVFPFDVNNLQCIECPPGKEPSTSLYNTPICSEKKFGDLTGEEERLLVPRPPDNVPLLNVGLSPAIDDRFKKLFRYPNERHVPDPCSFDHYTGRPFDKDESKLVWAPWGDNDRVYFCASYSHNVVTMISSDDYLRNNGGRFANRCIRVNDTEYRDETDETFILEYWNKPRDTKEEMGKAYIEGRFVQPIVGYMYTMGKLKNTLETNRELKVAIESFMQLHDDMVINKATGSMGKRVNSSSIFIIDPNSLYPRFEFETKNDIYVIFYNAVYPDSFDEPVFPLSKDKLYTELGTEGLPAVSTGFFGPLWPVIIENHEINSPPCDQVGRLSMAEFVIRWIAPIGITFDPSHLFTSYISCIDTSDNERLPIVPNFRLTPDTFGRDYIGSAGVLRLKRYGSDTFRISNVWLGEEKYKGTYIENLKSLPDRNVWR